MTPLSDRDLSKKYCDISIRPDDDSLVSANTKGVLNEKWTNYNDLNVIDLSENPVKPSVALSIPSIRAIPAKKIGLSFPLGKSFVLE